MQKEENKTEKQEKNTSGINILVSFIFYISILFFIIGFNFSDRMAGNWYQQFMPNIGTQQINDIIFLDSLNGFAVSSKNINPDTSSILRTTNGGDTWQLTQTLAPRRFSRIKFVNNTTGFISGGSGSGTPYLYKTVDGGNTWNTIPGATLGNALWGDMAVISEDTIWLTDANSLNGGVYRTTNGGANWEQQLNLGSSNPNKIYMINGNTGFITKLISGSDYTRKTTNSGLNWFVITSGSGESFYDMYFSDEQTGWANYFNTRKTTNGGTNWTVQPMPTGGNIIVSTIEKFSGLNKDTIYGVGASVNTGSGIRGMINRTTNGGINWLYQVPDSGVIQIGQYSYIDFVNKYNGWAYRTSPTGIHTTTGGDPVWLTPIQQISSEVPEEYSLDQNYPNPFNPITNIKYQISNNTYIKLVVYDIQGKLITELVNQRQQPGVYKVDWNASGFASGIYLYSLIIDGKIMDTKKMILIK